jgi:hypothetical protein
MPSVPTDHTVSLYLARYYLHELQKAQQSTPPDLHAAICHFHASAIFAKAAQDTMTNGMKEYQCKRFLASHGLDKAEFRELANFRNNLSHQSIPFPTSPNPDVTVHGSHARIGSPPQESDIGFAEHHLKFIDSGQRNGRAEVALSSWIDALQAAWNIVYRPSPLG